MATLMATLMPPLIPTLIPTLIPRDQLCFGARPQSKAALCSTPHQPINFALGPGPKAKLIKPEEIL